MDHKKHESKEVSDISLLQNKAKDKAFRMMMETLVIFGLPAVVAVVFGGKLDAYFSSGKSVTIGLLVCTFIFSWVIVFLRYRQLDKELINLDKMMKEVKGR